MAHILGSIPHEITSHMPGPSRAPAELFWGAVVHECQSVSSGLFPRRRGQVMTSDDKFSWMYPLVNIQKAIENGPFIVDFPIKNGDFP